MTKARIEELEQTVAQLQSANADLSMTLQDAQQAAIEKATADAAENLRLRKQLISSQRMLGMFARPPAPDSPDVVEPTAEEEEAPEPPKPARKTRHAVRK